MSDHQEEQEMEAEALAAIFDTAFQIQSSSNPSTPRQWAVTLLPADILDENDENCHVAIQLIAKLPLNYPEALPELDMVILKGLTNDQHQPELVALAVEEAQAQESSPSIYAICEKLKEWLSDHNVKGLDDVSMHAQMMRRKLEAEKEKQRAVLEFEAQKKDEEMTEAEVEDLEVRKRRAEGTPCTRENFEAWKARFEAEMAALKAAENEEANNANSKSVKKNKPVGEDKSGRMKGAQYFTGKNIGNLEAIEAEVEKAEAEAGDDDQEFDVDEDLFDDDDEDLDDLDFEDDDEDDDDEEDDEDDNEEPDI